ncbi:MAG: hypothetical protein J6C28_02415 [Bacilli bacterium]|nr:hypothetical protein [Bacilli bacterium]
MKKIYKNKCLVIIMILILIILSSFLSIIIYKNHNNKIDIQLSNQSWDSYDESIKNIKNNMDPITEPNENFFWWTLKDFDIEDNEYEKILNSLVAQVRMCYLDYTDDGTLYTNSNPIRKYRKKDIITTEELKKLNFDMSNDRSCINRFDDFNSLLISNDENLRNRFLNRINKINLIKSTELFRNENASYNELLLRKTIEVHYIEDMSEFLVEEYNRLK